MHKQALTATSRLAAPSRNRISRIRATAVGTTRLLRTATVAGLALCLLPATAAWASKGHSGGAAPATSGRLALVSDKNWNNPNSPSWCLNEDDYDQQTYSGSLSGSYSVSEQLCNSSTDYSGGTYWSAGGIGLQSDVAVVGQLSDISITAPDGTVHHAVLMNQTTSKGTTTYYYSVCYVPTYSESTNTSGTPLPGGSWQITLSGQITTATWHVNAQMTGVQFQQTYCPASEQNLIS